MHDQKDAVVCYTAEGKRARLHCWTEAKLQQKSLGIGISKAKPFSVVVMRTNLGLA